jgi:hypothetical protein
MHVSVRFEGHGGQYIERKMEYQLDAAGDPVIATQKVVSTDDHESGLNKAVMKTRIYGGFGSSLLGMAGINMVGLGIARNVGKGFLWAGTALGAAAVAAEASAYVTKRNDAYWPNLAMNAYDTAWMGLYAYSRTFGAGAKAAAAGAGAAGAKAGANATDLLVGNTLAGVGALGTGKSMLDARNTLELAGAHGPFSGSSKALEQLRAGAGITGPNRADGPGPLDGWQPDLGVSGDGPRLAQVGATAQLQR